MNVYVYAPYTAWAYVFAGHDDCSDGVNLLDLSRDNMQGTALNLYVNYPAVKSVEFERPDSCCPTDSCGDDDLENAVKVSLYSNYNKQGYIGAILYGHLVDPTAAGWQNLTGNFVKRIGKIVDAPGNCDCYTGDHVHMEVWNGQRLVSHYDYCYEGTTAIYKWVY